jgi:hypothetical protein
MRAKWTNGFSLYAAPILLLQSGFQRREIESRGRPGRSYLIIRLKYRTDYRQLIYKSEIRDRAENKKTE